MNKTLKQMQADSKLCDCFVYVLDARCPSSCINPEFLRVIKDKPIIYVLNKADLANPTRAEAYKQTILQNGGNCILLDATKQNSSKIILNEINKIFSDRLKNNQNKQANFIIRAMILGVPNSGKSTIVNNLCGKQRAITGNRAGVTKNKQWIRLGSVEVMDTPGVLLPNFDNETNAYNLAFVGSVKDEVVNIVDVSCQLIKRLIIIDANIITARYGVDAVINTENMGDAQALEILSLIGRKRGCVIKGGEVDYERVAKILITDFRSGKLGRISLE